MSVYVLIITTASLTISLRSLAPASPIYSKKPGQSFADHTPEPWKRRITKTWFSRVLLDLGAWLLMPSEHLQAKRCGQVIGTNMTSGFNKQSKNTYRLMA